MVTLFFGQEPRQKPKDVATNYSKYPQLKLDVEKYVLNFYFCLW